MSLRHLDGFDRSNFRGCACKYSAFFGDNPSNPAIGDGGEAIAGAPGPANSGPNGLAFMINNTGSGGQFFSKILDPQANWFLGFDWTPFASSGITIPQSLYYAIASNAGTLLELHTSADGRGFVELVQGTLCSSPGTLIARSASPFSANSFGFFEIVASFGMTVSYALYFNNSLIPKQGGGFIQDTNINFGTSGAVPDRFNHSWFAAGTGNGYAMDNYYICDGQDDGSGLNQRLGPCRVTTLSPSLDGTVNWTSNHPEFTNFKCVDDLEVLIDGFGFSPDGTNTMLTPNSPSALALFSLGFPTISGGNVRFQNSPCFGRNLAVALNLVTSPPNPFAGGAVISQMVKMRTGLFQIGAATVNYNLVANEVDDLKGYATYQAIAPNSFASGGPWVDAEIDGVTWGAKCDPSVTTLQLTQVYLEKLTTLSGASFTCGQSSYSFGK